MRRRKSGNSCTARLSISVLIGRFAKRLPGENFYKHPLHAAFGVILREFSASVRDAT
jgi:hypothetical protein